MQKAGGEINLGILEIFSGESSSLSGLSTKNIYRDGGESAKRLMFYNSEGGGSQISKSACLRKES